MDDKCLSGPSMDDKNCETTDVLTRRELNARYRAIPINDKISIMLRHYFNAMSHLYGTIRVSDAWSIIHEQNPGAVSKEEFLSFAKIARQENEDYYILGMDELYEDGKPTALMDQEIIDVGLLQENLDAYHAVLRGHNGKPFYIPKKTLFLKYSNAFFYEKARTTDVCNNFLRTQFKLSEIDCEDLFDDLLLLVQVGNTGFSEAMNFLADRGFKFSSQAAVEQFADIFTEFHNNTRMQYNRGFTPNETMSMEPPENRIPKSITFGPNIKEALNNGNMNLDELRKGILAMDVPNEDLRQSMLTELEQIRKTSTTVQQQDKPKQKAGRNDPCPCGSGKKFKKCCGK